MKFFLTLLVPMVVALGAPKEQTVPNCFKVHSLLRMDEEHYWANWTNACPYTIDSVYVMVQFTGRSNPDAVEGVWALHFVTPGAHQVMRLTTPMSLADFDSVRVSKITTDSMEALQHGRNPQYQAARDANSIGDPGPGVPPLPELIRAPLNIALPPAPIPAVVPEPLPPPPHDESASAQDHNRRGRELLQKGNYREAVEELSEAIRLKSDFALAYNARGFGYYMLRQYSRALADLDEAIRLNPQYLNAYQNRSRARKAAGDSTGSSADGKKAIALAKTSTE